MAVKYFFIHANSICFMSLFLFLFNRFIYYYQYKYLGYPTLPLEIAKASLNYIQSLYGGKILEVLVRTGIK